MSRITKALKMLKKISEAYPEKGVKEISLMIGVHFSQFYRWEQGQEPLLESYLKVEKVYKGLQ